MRNEDCISFVGHSDYDWNIRLHQLSHRCSIYKPILISTESIC